MALVSILRIHSGLGTKISNDFAPWLTLIHCFNHRLELSIKDAFNGTFFDEIDTMLLKLYYLYKKSPKRLRELNEFGEIFEKIVPKPSKSSGTRWISHKVQSMEIVLFNYGVFITHLESLAQTDSQALKRAKLVGFARKWVQAKYPIHLALYLDILQPIKVLSLVMQQEIHDPVVQLKHIRDFTWSMTKLSALLQESIEKTTTHLTNFMKFQKEVTFKEGAYIYQNIKLLNYDVSNDSIIRSYDDIIKLLTDSTSKRFANLQSHPVFKNINILDCSRWPNETESLSSYGEKEINKLVKHFSELLLKNSCCIDDVISEWDLLKLEVHSIFTECKTLKYLEIWQVFNSDYKDRCKSILHIIKLLLITPTTNAKLE